MSPGCCASDHAHVQVQLYVWRRYTHLKLKPAAKPDSKQGKGPLITAHATNGQGVPRHPDNGEHLAGFGSFLQLYACTRASARGQLHVPSGMQQLLPLPCSTALDLKHRIRVCHHADTCAVSPSAVPCRGCNPQCSGFCSYTLVTGQPACSPGLTGATLCLHQLLQLLVVCGGYHVKLNKCAQHSTFVHKHSCVQGRFLGRIGSGVDAWGG